jgi:hypothetical protein
MMKTLRYTFIGLLSVFLIFCVAGIIGWSPIPDSYIDHFYNSIPYGPRTMIHFLGLLLFTGMAGCGPTRRI